MSTLPTHPARASGEFAIGGACGQGAAGGSLSEEVAGPR